MGNNVFLYTLPQWFIFSSLLVIVYGWVEKKKPFRIIGLLIMIALGIFAVYAISKGYFLSSQFLTPEEIINEEIDGELIDEIPFEGMLLPAYWSFVLSGVLAIPAVFLDWKDKKPNRLLMVIAGLVSLFGFFIIVGALKFM
jgi:hypothetical protein